MFATIADELQNDLSFQSLNVDAKVVRPVALSGLKNELRRQYRAAVTPTAYSLHDTADFLAPIVTERDPENVKAADTWDTYLSTLRKATVEAIRAKKSAQRDYLNVLVEADAWSRRLEIALNNDCEDNVRKALWRKNALRDSARKLKALVEKHSVQVSTLKSQLAFWENQLTTDIDSPTLAYNISQ